MAGREYPERPLVGVGGVIIEGEQVLLVKRASEPLRGQWSLPGGLVETGERLAEAVRREMLEETGLHVRVEKMLKIVERITRDEQRRVRFHYVLADFLCRTERGVARAGSDVSEVHWARREEVRGFGVREAAVRVIERAFEASRRRAR
jgi:ADP-ribose pyrophosphatase YjhB (NUDIX family)